MIIQAERRKRFPLRKGVLKNVHTTLIHMLYLTRFSLANDIHAKNSLRNTFVLDCGGMFEAAVYNGAQQLRLQKEVAEAGTVD